MDFPKAPRMVETRSPEKPKACRGWYARYADGCEGVPQEFIQRAFQALEAEKVLRAERRLTEHRSEDFSIDSNCPLNPRDGCLGGQLQGEFVPRAHRFACMGATILSPSSLAVRLAQTTRRTPSSEKRVARTHSLSRSLVLGIRENMVRKMSLMPTLWKRSKG